MENWNKDDGINAGSEISEALDDTGSGKVLDLEKASEQMGGDEELLKEVLQIFIDDVPRKLYELHEACNKQDRERIKRAAHSIKGASANVAADRVRAVAFEIEKMVDEADLNDIRNRLEILEHEMQKLETAIDLALAS